ncbi:o-succinylbenzoate synthase, partial [Bacteroidota bacterium]
MNKFSLTYTPYTLQLKNPFITSKKTIKNRKGFIIELEDSEGNTGTGDVCPFPEFGSESLSNAENSLKGLNLNVKIDRSKVEESIYECLKDYNDLPALRHGIEQALINLLCRKENTSVNKFLRLKLKKKIKVNAAIGFMDAEKSAEIAKNLLKNGFRTLKIKVGRKNFQYDYSVIKAIRHKVGSEIKLRIDANGIWNLKDAIANLKTLDDFDIEYAEQPVNTVDDYMELKRNSDVPLAPDESIRSVKDAKQFIDSGTLSYIVLKPMMISGLLPTLEIINYAEENNVSPVITTSFDSAIGKSNAVIAAATVKS